ncbi:MAG TPA: alpha/beta hydrolase [Chryseosolibacter sp.]
MKFKSNVFILPGLGNSGEGHWQTIWERDFSFKRIHQRDWDTPDREEWVDTIQHELNQYDPSSVILVGHSLACSTVVYWSQKYPTKIKGALLVAPSDTESEVYPPGTTGFKPMPLTKLPFRSTVISSTNDMYVTVERANHFANAWGSKLILLPDAGHINVAAGFGKWPGGLDFLRQLDQ